MEKEVKAMNESTCILIIFFLLIFSSFVDIYIERRNEKRFKKIEKRIFNTQPKGD